MRGGKRLNRDALSLRGLYEWVQVLVCAVTATVLLFTFAARVVLVSGPYMRETLQHHHRPPSGYNPKRRPDFSGGGKYKNRSARQRRKH